MDDNIFELNQRSRNGAIIKVKYRGAWLVVDNGYLNWAVTVPPMKNTMYVSETRWSQWIESMRKDVECTFGILKGRFRILKAGVRCQGVKIADSVWMTCCALHNMLLEVDGITGEWDGEGGLFDFNCESEELPFALQRLSSPEARRNYDTSGMGVGSNLIEYNGDDDQEIPENLNAATTNVIDPRCINKLCLLSADAFRSKLIEHFDILFKQYKIKWTRRENSTYTPANII